MREVENDFVLMGLDKQRKWAPRVVKDRVSSGKEKRKRKHF